MDIWKEFYGPNAGYVIELYERYLQDPNSVDQATRKFFERWSPPSEAAPPGLRVTEAPAADKIIGAVNLAHAIRAYGHLEAQLDPLGSEPPGDPWIDLEYHKLTAEDLQALPESIVGGPIAEHAKNAYQAIQSLRAVYTGTIGYDYEHVHLPEEREWLHQAAERGIYRPPEDPIDPEGLLERLTRVETFEVFLHRMFPGRTRFSIEGLDMLVPILDDFIGGAAEADICVVLIGMAHRGRINVHAHVLNKPYAQILAEFKDPGTNFTTKNELGWTGDVKYHIGARQAIRGGETVKMVVSMAPNPSHLENVNPVLSGMARSADSKVDEPGSPEFFPNAALPILIHGDAAFTGQGVVAETLNFSKLPGYTIGGTLHIIANNQLGYTATEQEVRSTLYASDLAKGFEIPVIHVNADDPEACIEAARTAFAYRQKFHKDFLIDLIGYRRYGHNEGDEPSFTQPLMYKKIDEHPTVRKIWADELIKRGEIEEDWPEKLINDRMDELQKILEDLQPEEEILKPRLEPPPPGEARRVKTHVPLEELRELNESLLEIPGDFHLHRKIERSMRQRRKVLAEADEASIDWATAEELALASILTDGIPIRMTGEDVERGTFSQRHAVFHDTETGETYTPLQQLRSAKASFEIVNSPLSENGSVGFEFGYNIQNPRCLVIWEAQYGDFVNNAQPMIDEFVTSARAKWEQTPSLVLLLPQGYEGQGPDHSTGRVERFLQLAAQTNIRIANCTTSAQYFHLLRRQAELLKSDPLPLIVMTPKSLLRHPKVASTPNQLAEGAWEPVIDDERARNLTEDIQRLILCSGKIYVDLITSKLREEAASIAIVRLEQLYPFPAADLEPLFSQYKNLGEVVWVQEEPKNMGAWSFAQPRIQEMVCGRWPLHYIGRVQNSSPAEGSSAWHSINQKAIIEQAFNLDAFGETDEEIIQEGGIVERE
ncbi:MAG: 2-oxoglutarate dehydrogenase E1 component [Anaerolineales bacterium]|jgi:2-oxoglutarate dehydrogenase E1 component